MKRQALPAGKNQNQQPRESPSVLDDVSLRTTRGEATLGELSDTRALSGEVECDLETPGWVTLRIMRDDFGPTKFSDQRNSKAELTIRADEFEDLASFIVGLGRKAHEKGTIVDAPQVLASAS